MDLSVLDVLPVSSSSTAREALGGALALARVADNSGYRRLWFAEHHGMANIASTSPELLIAHVAPATERIRLGAGGVMLPNHAPLRVVEQYRTLEALHPGRIDLGIGRAAGTDPLTAHALRSSPGEKFAALLGETLAFDGNEFPEHHPYARIEVTPGDVRLPPIWMLGSSGGSARLAGELGLGYAFAGHFSPSPAAPSVASYRKSFVPSAAFAEPRVILAVHVLCADTEDEVQELALAPLYALAQIEQGRTAPVMTPAAVRETGFSLDQARGTMAKLLMYGTPDQLRGRLEALAVEAQADELMVMTLSHAAEPRLRSYQLLARAFDLK
ncbi:MAG TPA: LLM class flavin-dependent oxidoreductase [Polyangiaceae bacterium]